MGQPRPLESFYKEDIAHKPRGDAGTGDADGAGDTDGAGDFGPGTPLAHGGRPRVLEDRGRKNVPAVWLSRSR